VQVYIFKDRVEIISPGGLPAGMTEADLGKKSIPRNPLLFSMLFRMEAVEHIGSGIKRISRICDTYGVAAPKILLEENWFTVSFFRPSAKTTDLVMGEITTEVTPQVINLLSVIKEEMDRERHQQALALKDRFYFREAYLAPALAAGLIEMTIPDKPRSSRQKYRLTEKGRKFAEKDK
jgi:ATP-dependent DNA helicase RecG